MSFHAKTLSISDNLLMVTAHAVTHLGHEKLPMKCDGNILQQYHIDGYIKMKNDPR
jgi:hypothetical protein